MTKRRTLAPKPFEERRFRDRYEFPEGERQDFLKRLGAIGTEESRESFMRSLERLITVFRYEIEGQKSQPTGSEVRTEIRKLHLAIEMVRSIFARQLSQVENEQIPTIEILDDPLQDRMMEKLAIALEPALTDRLIDVSKADRWGRKLPIHRRNLLNFQLLLEDISQRIAEASMPSPQESKGGAPRKRSKQQFVELMVYDHWQYFDKIPPTTKKSPFEKIASEALVIAGYKNGNVNDVIIRAVRTAKRNGKPSIVAIQSRTNTAKS